MKGKVLICLLLLSLLLVGCIPKEIIEDLSIITARGIDTLEDDLIETTLVTFQFDAQSDSITKIASGTGKTLKGSLNNASLESGFMLTAGKVEIEMYGREAAEKGILPSLDAMVRDARIANTMYLVISDTTAKEILMLSEDNISMNIGEYLNRIVENNATDHNFPRITLQDFLPIYYDVGQDNVLPIFEIINDKPKINKIGVFKADKLVGELSIQEATFLNLLLRTVKEKLLGISFPVEPFKNHLEKAEFPNPDKEVHMNFMIKKGKSKTKLLDKDGLVFQTDVKIDLQLLEQTHSILIKDGSVVKLIEKEVEKKMKTDFEKLLKKAQELGSDPFGYGIVYRVAQKDGKLTHKEWREKFPEIEVQFNVDADIYQHGTLE